MPRPTTLLAVTGVALGLAGAAAAARGVLVRQAAAARQVIGKPLGEEALRADKKYQKKYGATLDLLLVGDSIAAGLGAELPKETLGARLATRLAKATRRDRSGCGRWPGSASSRRCSRPSWRRCPRRTARTSR